MMPSAPRPRLLGIRWRFLWAATLCSFAAGYNAARPDYGRHQGLMVRRHHVPPVTEGALAEVGKNSGQAEHEGLGTTFETVAAALAGAAGFSIPHSVQLQPQPTEQVTSLEVGSQHFRRIPSTMHGDQLPFTRAIVLTVNGEKAQTVQHELAAAGIPSEPLIGFDARKETELSAGVHLLRHFGHGFTVHPSFSVPFACVHTSPNHAPNISNALEELWHEFTSPLHHLLDDSGTAQASQGLEALLAKDSHGCVAKVAAVAASHVQVWRELAAKTDTPEDDEWWLVLEDDVALCPHFLARLKHDLRRVPADAEVLKLSFFGPMRESDAASDSADGRPSPFLEARDPMDPWTFWHCISGLFRGIPFSEAPCAGFYAGNQAYMISKRGAQRLLGSLAKSPFQDIDITMMSAAKMYAWRHVLAQEGNVIDSEPLSLAQWAFRTQSDARPKCEAV
eukprot:gnl/TRDRNA2_/TRDRNA2_180821_c0_seq1.p1 gnl/TRDRNA2_/TRDRNA2_180821_c0~~gnl/TRDRNA2_/TRDRNA2_180821_c0_seq1.p1  ORF type:complete len:449 (+),score=68.65 gnl/TRDRNA2_/TRDRNA2_180821_c0_seq1:35-1381(+)